MRAILFLLCLGAAGFAGWITGSLYPAPPILLDPVRQQLSAAGDSLPARVETSPAEGTAPVAAPLETTEDQLFDWIEQARHTHPYPDSEETMRAVMLCESGGRAHIVNPAGPYTGLFQYSDQTWNGDWNIYRQSGPTDARAQIFATALAWQLGMQNQWGCYSQSQ